jgi:hypothetical protein
MKYAEVLNVSSSDYRERVPVPGWVTPVLAVVGGLWITRRARGLSGKGSTFRKVFSLVNAVSTAATLLGLVHRFGYVAVEVEEGNIHLGFGLMERTIATRNIRDIRVVPYNPVQFLGWGYRTGVDGRRAFSQIGVRRGVEITVAEEGRQRRYFISSNEPEALASAVAAVSGVSAPV